MGRVERAARGGLVRCRSCPSPRSRRGFFSFSENKWFPIAQATLGRRAPAVAAWLFHQLSQAEGAAVILTVSTFLDRVQALEDGTQGTAGLAGRDTALAVLVARGLDADTRAEARALLTALGQLDTSASPEPIDTSKDEDDLWQWYLEWSQVAQSVISERSALRALGFLKPVRAEDDEVEVDEFVALPGADGAAAAAPAPAAPAAPARAVKKRKKRGRG